MAGDSARLPVELLGLIDPQSHRARLHYNNHRTYDYQLCRDFDHVATDR